jgi:hypothetical protein
LPVGLGVFDLLVDGLLPGDVLGVGALWLEEGRLLIELHHFCRSERLCFHVDWQDGELSGLGSRLLLLGVDAVHLLDV